MPSIRDLRGRPVDPDAEPTNEKERAIRRVQAATGAPRVPTAEDLEEIRELSTERAGDLPDLPLRPVRVAPRTPIPADTLVVLNEVTRAATELMAAAERVQAQVAQLRESIQADADRTAKVAQLVALAEELK